MTDIAFVYFRKDTGAVVGVARPTDKAIAKAAKDGRGVAELARDIIPDGADSVIVSNADKLPTKEAPEQYWRVVDDRLVVDLLPPTAIKHG